MPVRDRKSNSQKALKRLKALRSVYEKPQALRTRFGLKRRKLSRGQKLLRMLSAR